MKQLFTSNYSRKGRDPKAVSISAKAPHYFFGRWYMHLAPSWEMINGIKYGGWTEADYTKAYLDLIIKERGLTPERVVDELADGSILLCYEKPSDFCHRHIAAEWIESGTGIVVREWQPPQEKTIVDELLEF